MEFAAGTDVYERRRAARASPWPRRSPRRRCRPPAAAGRRRPPPPGSPGAHAGPPFPGPVVPAARRTADAVHVRAAQPMVPFGGVQPPRQ